MFIAPVDATLGETEWRPFVETHPFGHLVAPGGPAREIPVVVPTQFVLADNTVWLHLVRANPVFEALAENPRVLLSVADDWAFIPSSWKVGRRRGSVARDPDDLLRRRATRRHGDGARRANVTGKRRRHPAAPAGYVPARRRGGRPRRGPCGEGAGDPRHRDLSGAGVGQVQVRGKRRRAPPAGSGGAATGPRWPGRRRRGPARRPTAGRRDARGSGSRGSVRVQKRRGRAGRGGSAITRRSVGRHSAVTRRRRPGSRGLLPSPARRAPRRGRPWPVRRRRTTACGGPPRTR